MNYHRTSEEIVKILQDQTQRDDVLFFRLLVGYYFCLVASQMRCNIASPDLGEIPINMYVLNLAPSGYGKTMSTNIIESKVINKFRRRFIEETLPVLAEQNLPRLANKRSIRKATDPDVELEKVRKEYERLGEFVFSFDSGTSPAVKQMRHMLLMANAGSMNLIMDEVGANLTANIEVFDTFIELFDKGYVKQKLVKNTGDSLRNEEIIGKTPANLLMFGVPSRLLDGAKTEEALMTMLHQGYARRCFFGLIKNVDRKPTRNAEQMYLDRTNTNNVTNLNVLSNRLENLADIVNAGKKIIISRENCILLNEYQLHCEARANHLPDHQEMQKRELSERAFKVRKVAGGYAFIDESPEITQEHIENAIKLAEDSGEAFTLMLSQDKPWVKLAKYVASVGSDITQADLSEDLPFYRGGVGHKAELLTLAIAYGYKNNIIIKKTFSDGIEFLRGETLKQTDLDKCVISYSNDMTTGYRNEKVPFSMLHKLTQAQGMHWLNHHLDEGYRSEENIIPGFNLIVLDVDSGESIQTVKTLMNKYKAMYYTTKRHTDEANRFRIILPINYELYLDSKDFKEFYKNILEWLPFKVDEPCGHRSKKWLSHNNYYEYTDGELLNALLFIPKTSKNEERKLLLNSQESMDNLERWVINNTGDGNRNNMLLRYGMILVDAGFDLDKIRIKIMDLNHKLPDKLDEAELISTVFMTVSKELIKRSHQ